MLIGSMLCVLGVVTYAGALQFGAPTRSPTALIPAIFGAILLLLGYIVIRKPDLRKHVMHAAVALALLGFLASFPMGLIGLMKKGATLAPISQIIMGALTGIYVALGVRSFIAARRARLS